MKHASALSCCLLVASAVPAAGGRGPCFSALERHLRVVVVTGVAAQASGPATMLLDRAYVHDVRRRRDKGDPAITTAIATLDQDAKKALAIAPMSVMDKAIMPPSGDRHDYVSQAPYWWPDPSKPDGKPYIRKDGERNPEISKITDRDNLGRLGDAVATLSLAYSYTGREEYAAHAARLVRVWFVDPATRMNPHLQFGQYIPGINQGRGIGIIETRNLPELLDGIMLISGSPAWTKADDEGLQAWMRAYLAWLVESSHGREESKNGNNHETWYDVQVAGLALYTGQVDVARRTIEGARARIAAQSSLTAVSHASSSARAHGTTASSTSPRSWISRRSGRTSASICGTTGRPTAAASGKPWTSWFPTPLAGGNGGSTRSRRSARARCTRSCAAARSRGRSRNTGRWRTRSAAAARGSILTIP